MIYTCTFNPAIDLFVRMKKLEPNLVNRTMEEDYQPNGKGINVSIMLKQMQLETTALGFIGGFSGRFIAEELEKMKIATNFIEIEGITRINVFANADQEFKIVNNGPAVSREASEAMLAQIKQLPRHSKLVVSGSLPKNVEDDIHVEVARICQEREVDLVLDISSPALMDCLPYRPYLLKPNDDELGSFFGINDKPLSENQVVSMAQRLLEKGAKQVIVSRGEKGSIYISKERIVIANAPKGEVVNTACSGDALLAAFLGRRELQSSLEESMTYASAAGTATACSKGLAGIKDIKNLLSEVHLTFHKGGTINA
ncbi:1-phosphofructokinase [Salibacterium aidingense]|uniref:1-phosphofructokinase n=1 Tax=Salibacterium aidingense TaxID=384933 RepID=UPI00040A297B|nr:1-phosphofructokinase [Salibacterium aidingense]